jgi:Holliday junction resolvase RusA-like endonuclease
MEQIRSPTWSILLHQMEQIRSPVTVSFSVSILSLTVYIKEGGHMITDLWQQPVTFVVQGVPVAKARPRVLRSGHTYTPARSAAYERHVKLAATLAMRGHARLSAAVRATLRFDLPVPASWSARKRAAAITGEIAPAGKPDLDNLLKSVLDGIRTIVIGDDAVIVDVRATKRYGVGPLTVCTIGPSGTPTIAPVE